MMTAEALVSSADEIRETPALLATIRAAKAGHSGAFEELMIATERRVAIIAWRILGDVEEVKEAVQETFLRLFRHLRRFDEERDFYGWQARIAINVCRDLDRGRRRRRIFTQLDETVAYSSRERIDDALATRREVALVGRAIDTLPERERLAILLRDVEGFSNEEIANILGNTPGTVRVQVSKARAKVRAWVEAWRKGARP